MKLVVATHSGVLAVNRKVFVSLAEQTGWEVTLIVPQSWKGDLIQNLVFKPENDEKKINIIPMETKLSGNGSFFYYRGKLPETLSPDLVFLFEEPWSINALQFYWKFRKVKKVFFTNQNIYKILPPPFNWIQRFVLKKSIGAYPVSDEAGEVLRRKNYRGPMKKLPYSYDPSLFKKADADEFRALRTEFNLPQDSTIIAYVGRLTEEKGIRDFIDAIRLYHANPSNAGKKTTFLIVGNGELKDQIPQDLVQFMPALPHDQVGKLIRALDVLVLPSRTRKNWKEQFGRILVEAWASGAAMIGSDSGEIPNLIRLTQGGLVFREQDPNDLAQQLKQITDSSERLKEYKRQGNEYVTRHFTHEAVAKYMAETMREFLKNQV